MARIQWKDRFNINYKRIDDQHRKLVAILNDLIDLISMRSSPDQVGPIFHRLFEYTQVHFVYEERFMQKARFVGVLAHKAEHASFNHKLLDLNQRYDASNPMLLEETLSFLQHWYLHHIMDVDTQYAPFLRGLINTCNLRGIVFDSASVLFPFDLHCFVEGVARLAGTEPGTLAEALAREDALADYAQGGLTSAAFAGKLAELAGATLPDPELAGAYADAFRPAEPALELLPRLRPGYKLGLVAFAGEWYSERVLDPSPARRFFDAAAVSWRLGAAPGDVAPLEDVLQQLDLLSEECLLVSADEAFLARAREARFRTLACADPAGLEAALRKAGIEFQDLAAQPD